MFNPFSDLPEIWEEHLYWYNEFPEQYFSEYLEVVFYLRWFCPAHNWEEYCPKGNIHGSCPICGGYLLD